MEKSKNMANSERNFTRKGCPFIKPWGSVRIKRDVQNFGARTKCHKHTQGIFHDRIARGHTTVFGTGAQKYIIGRDGW